MSDQAEADGKAPSAELDLLESQRSIEELILDVIRALGHACFGQPPPHFGKYEVRRVLGDGGYGAVFQAWDAGIDREVAIKLCACDPEMDVALTLVEARALGKLSHPNVVVVFDFDAHEDRFFLVMEYIDGGTLRDYAIEGKRRSWQELVEVFADVARGVAHAHDKGVIHGDLKPGNILLSRTEHRPRVADFGLARMVGKQTLMPDAIGTLLYAAPEVLAGKLRDALSDQWSFFVSLLHCIERKLPIIDTNDPNKLPATIEQMREAIERWVGPSTLDTPIPKELAEVLRVGLSLDPRERFPDMHAVAGALDALLASAAGPTLVVAPASEGVVVGSPVGGPALSTSPPWWRKRGLSALVLTMGVGLVMQAYWLGRRHASGAHHVTRVETEGAEPVDNVDEEPTPTDVSQEIENPPCVIGDVPIEPDPSIEAMCRILRTEDYEDVDALWEELSNSRELSARSSEDWVALGHSATVLEQTSLDEAGEDDSKRSRELRKCGKQFAEDAEWYLSQATGDETAKAVSPVSSSGTESSVSDG